ncbi:MAG TPA: biotin-dependent carboxyltransferase family protein [Rhodanobacteraceae bacterium]|nr:biotin-dependent carboxyltransferase family protein [Rhodanobacteraceae bacterium]
MTIEVLKPGLLTTPQDLGRIGYTHLGVGHAGAFDLPALRLANALAGNPPGACVLEITLLGPTLKFHADAWIALTGASIVARTDEQAIPMWTPCFVRKNSVLALGAIRQGCRAYFAVHGGFDFEPVLGSRSLDVNAGFGPFGRPLRSGDMLETGSGSFFPAGPETSLLFAWNEPDPRWSIDPRPWFDADQEHPLRLSPGTHAHLLDASSRESLYAQSFRIAAESNRVGCRLEGEPLEFPEPVEIVSEACVAGTVQLPPSGQPIALGVEHPVSGGYPRIGQIAAVDLPRLAQRRPGDALRFAPCSLEEARLALRDREQQLHEMETLIANRLKQGA